MQTFSSWKSSKIIHCSIANCNKEHDKNHYYTAYQIVTKVENQAGEEIEFVANRRFSQFYWLSKRLLSEYPTRIVPSLPGRGCKPSTGCSLDYLDRFEDNFVEKRKISLQRFLDFVVEDEDLVSSESLLLFLTHETLPMELYKVEHANLVDRVFALAFGGKIQVTEEAFLSLYKRASDWGELLGKIQESSEVQMNSFAKCAKKSLSNGMYFQELPHELALPLGECLKNSAKAADSLQQSMQKGLFLLVQDVEGFMENAKYALQAREFMQEKYQENQKKLRQLTFERETSSSSRPLNRKFLHYYHKAMENFIRPQSIIFNSNNNNPNASTSQQKENKLSELEKEITHLEQQISHQKDHFLHQNEQLIQNFNEFFQRINQAFTKEIRQFAAEQAEYHRKCSEIWSAFGHCESKEQEQ